MVSLLCMEMRLLGATGLYVSALGLGTLTWGEGTGYEDAAEIYSRFREAGGTLVDVADTYGGGAAQQWLGEFLAESRREDVQVAGMSGYRPDHPRRFDSSRGYLLSSLDRTLEALGVEYLDLWQVHAWDARTPAAETMSALADAVRQGKARYAGVANYTGWQTAKSAVQAVDAGAPLASAQWDYSLVRRGAEREAIPAALDAGMGVIASSPLAGGALTGKYRHKVPPESRGALGVPAHGRPEVGERSRRIVDAVCVAADGLACSPADIALAWLRERRGVSSVLLGVRTPGQLMAALASDRVVIPDEIYTALDEVSAPELEYPEQGWAQD